MPKLTVIKGPMRSRTFDLEEDGLLGRSPSCQIYIGDLTVSRHHARLRRTDQGFLVEDLGSGNGTFVNSVRITQRVLRDGDELTIGDCVFRFIADEKQDERWVSMVTVVASNEAGLIAIDSEPKIKLFDTTPDVDEADLKTDLVRAHRMLQTLYEVSDATSSVLEPTDLFNRILDLLFKFFPDAERGFIMQLDERNQLIPGAIRRRKAEGHTKGLVVSHTVVDQVMHGGKSVLCGIGEETIPGAGVSKMCAPLTAQGETLGILHIEGKRGGTPFSQEDLDLLTGIARQAGIAMLNASMHQRVMKQQRLEQDLRFAKQVQQSFLPPEPPEVPGFSFSRRYNPMFDVGGDFYDFITLPDGKIGVLIGDVSGKGVSAALLMARLTSDMRYYAITEVEPRRVLDQTNRSLIDRIQDNMFATVLYLVLEPASGKIVIGNAGHLPPFVRLAEGNAVLELDEGTNLALGVLPDPLFEQVTVDLAPGDSFVLYTDGLVEAKNGLGEEYGFERLHAAVAHAPEEGMLDHILRDLIHFTGTTSQYDDLTMVAFTYSQKKE